MTTSSVLSCLCIGDPHFKSDNQVETELMSVQIVEIILQKRPDFIVVLGDILHRHERIDLSCMKRAIDFLRKIREVSKWMYVLIGNHDRENNKVGESDQHAFGALSDWQKTTVIDNVEVRTHRGSDGVEYKFILAPYLPNGTLIETFAKKGLEMPLKGFSGVFSHQEYAGCKINLITKSEVDAWPLSAPVNFSGHIHDYEEVQSNLYYAGTPIQHNFSDLVCKSVSLIEYESSDVAGVAQMKSHQRISLKIPRKFVISLTPEQLSTYVVPSDVGSIKIRVETSAAVFKEVMALDTVKRLGETHGVKIVHVDAILSRAGALQDAPKTRTSFQERILTAVQKEDAQIQAVFRHLFINTS